jgi:transcriptional regulator of met regulon
MQRVETLREQASLLRRLAASFGSPQIKEDLLRLAARCDRLAADFSQQFTAQQMRPDADLAKNEQK